MFSTLYPHCRPTEAINRLKASRYVPAVVPGLHKCIFLDSIPKRITGIQATLLNGTMAQRRVFALWTSRKEVRTNICRFLLQLPHEQVLYHRKYTYFFSVMNALYNSSSYCSENISYRELYPCGTRQCSGTQRVETCRLCKRKFHSGAKGTAPRVCGLHACLLCGNKTNFSSRAAR